MRLKRLELKAFGPFTDRILDFDGAVPGLHVIFGRNEAGKSSSLRALKALLYGFPQQTPDNFIHNYDQLLVGGCIVSGTGQELVFQRRKKRHGDVLDAAGNPVDTGILTPFLHGVEPDIFASLYGIDHDSLIRGGEEILAQKGEVGQALFAAGAGISSLREVILQLEADAGELFKAMGKNQAINRAVARYKELQGEAKKACLSAREWQELRKDLEEAATGRTALEAERDAGNKEVQRLQRLVQAIPELAALQSRREQLAALGEVVVLDPGFGERYLSVDRELREAGLQLQKDSERLVRLIDRQKSISPNRALLDQATRVDDLHQRLGEYRKGQKDRPERNGMRIGLRTEAGRLLQQVRPELDLSGVEILRPLLTAKRTVQDLVTRHEAIRQKLEAAQQQGRAAELEREAVVGDLAAIPVDRESHNLLQAVRLTQKAGDIDGLLAKGTSEIALNRKQSLAELKRIGLWNGQLAELMELALPLPATLQRFDQAYVELGEERRELDKDHRNLDRELKAAEAERGKLARGGQAPSEEELLAIRARREHGWQLVRRQWLDREDVEQEICLYSPGQPLAESYEGYVSQADGVADRLRREADRVAGIAAVQAQLESLQEALAANNRARQAVQQRAEAVAADWRNIWQPAGITPLSPREMGGWLAEIDRLRFRVGEIFKKEQELDRIRQRRTEFRQTVVSELSSLTAEQMPAGEELGPVQVLAETVLDQIARRKAVREKLQERLAQATGKVRQSAEDLRNGREALAGWREEWQRATVGLCTKDLLAPLDAVERLEILQNCFDRLAKAEEMQKRIDGIDRDAAGLAGEVRALLAQVAPGLGAMPLDQAILQLRAMLGQAQQERTLDAQMAEEIAVLRDQIAATEKNLKGARYQMAELLKTAACAQPEELPAVIERYAVYKKLQEKIADTEASLAQIGAGVSLAELAQQAAEVHIDELPGMVAALARDTEERINPEINRISQRIGEIGVRLAAMDGSGRAAELAERMEQELALIRRLTERYAVVKLAAKILQQEIERYREEHQAPVLKLGSRYFRELTRGSFIGLRADVDDKGEPVLVGVRSGDRRLTVDKMSSGTRDQLYLALRLATLEWRLAKNEPMPFIVDDILINFDDDRSKATLAVFAELAGKNQVILFTHHRRIVDEASGMAAQGNIQIHEL